VAVTGLLQPAEGPLAVTAGQALLQQPFIVLVAGIFSI